jgi:hypothetical protein
MARRDISHRRAISVAGGGEAEVEANARDPEQSETASDLATSQQYVMCYGPVGIGSARSESFSDVMEGDSDEHRVWSRFPCPTG